MNRRSSLENVPNEFDSVAEFVDNSGAIWHVAAELKSIRGRARISAVTIWPAKTGTPLTRQVLRDLPLGKLFFADLAVESKKLSQLAKRSKVSQHRGRAHSEAELRKVADVYLAAYRAHQPVQQSVANALGIPVSTAAKRIMAARRLGFLTEVAK